MLVYIIKRIILFFPLIIGMAILVFSLQFMIPGDPAEVFLGEQASPEAVEKLREKLGFNEHPVVQLGMYMGRLIKGDLGTSIFQNRSVNKAVFERLPATIELAVCGILCLPSYGREMSLLSAIGVFLLGKPDLLLETIKHLILPSFALGFLSMAYITRTTRSSMITTLKEDYIRTAKAKGLKKIVIVYKHALRNALIPVISIMGLQLGALMGGAVLTETIFSWPGLGRLALVAIDSRGNKMFESPNRTHWLGTDNFGRDLWSRIALGSRVSALIAILSVSASAILGTLAGLYAGYKGGWFDLIIMRIVDIFLGFPVLILSLALVAALGPGEINIVIALIFVYWGRFTRIVRGETLSAKESDYVVAARTLGASTTRILFVHILRNIWGPPVVFGTLSLGTAILTESALSFLGFGASPPTPTWGWIMAYGLRYIQTVPWFPIVPGLAIMITVLGFNLFGDGLQDYLDPKNRTL